MADPDPALLARWDASDPMLIADTPTSRVFRVRLAGGGTAVVKNLKPIGTEDELRGADFLGWRNGHGCVRLRAREGASLLLEDAGDFSLLAHLDQHGDAAATMVMADAVASLHRPSAAAVPAGLQRLEEHFASLFALADRPDAPARPFVVAAAVARALLDDQRDVRPLHGDLHHENLLRAERGWLAIDPKGLLGDPAYDVANMFYNPLGRDDLRTDPQRIGFMARVLAQALGREPAIVLRYAFAHASLSAAWHTEDGDAAKAANSLGVAAAIHPLLANPGS